MEVLFISAVLPYPLHSGGQVRMYNLLKHLSGEHRITLFSFIRSDSERQYLKQLDFLAGVELFYRGKRYHPRYLVRSLTGIPLLLASYRHDGMRRRITAFLAEHPVSLIHAEPFYVAPSLPDRIPPLVVSEHNVEYQVYRDYARKFRMPLLRPLLGLEATGIGLWETRTLRAASHVTAVSEGDAGELRRLAPRTPVTVVPNGVDVSWFRFTESRFRGGPVRALFVGNFNWVPNREAADRLVRHIWPAVRKRFPDAGLTIVGRDIPAALASTGDHVRLCSDIGDIRDAFADADVLLAPMGIAGGSKFKILEAMASGVPVVTTAAGAAGLPVENGVHARLAATPPEYVTAVAGLSEEKTKRTRMIRNARRLVERSFDWKQIAGIMSGVWQEAVS